jgi:hypothetical protein
LVLDDARLLDGWHAAEQGLRWTDGDAGMRVAGSRVLRLRIAGLGRYWTQVRAAARTNALLRRR